MPFNDHWLSPVSEDEVLFLGYRPTKRDEINIPFDLYNSLIESIRLTDSLEGNLLYYRKLQGAQRLFSDAFLRFFDIKELKDIERCNPQVLDQYIRYLGFSSDRNVYEDLSVRDKRKLLETSIRFWKRKGLEKAYVSLIDGLSGYEYNIWDWFFNRSIIDNIYIGDHLTEHDSLFLDTFYSEERPSYKTMIYVVDEDLNKKLFMDLLKLSRPASERLFIQYCYLLDKFTKFGLTNWDTNNVELDDVNHIVLFNEHGHIVTNRNGRTRWNNYTTRFRASLDNVNSTIEVGLYSGSDDYRRNQLNVQFGINECFYREFYNEPDTPQYEYPDSIEYDELVVGRLYTFMVDVYDTNDNQLRISIYLDGNKLATIIRPKSRNRGRILLYSETGNVRLDYIDVHDIYNIDYTGVPLIIRPKYVEIDTTEVVNYGEFTNGGEPPYIFDFVENNSGGTITQSGLYTSGATGNVVDFINVTDSVNQTSQATVRVR